MAKLSTYPKSTDFTGAYITGIDADGKVTNFDPLYLPASGPVTTAITNAVSTETTNRQDADTAEASAREAGDGNLQNQIDNLSSTYLTISTAAGTFMPKSGGTFTGPISGITATTGNNSTLYATTAFVATAVANGLGTITKASLGLGNVDNTSDVNKPVSTAQQAALDTKVDKTSVGAANGVAPLGSDSKIPAVYLPGSIDEIDEFANLAAFPATGAANKLYVALDTEKVYRWGGSSYIEISPSPGSTDAVPEGSSNLYFTNARAVAALSSTLANYLTTATAASTYLTQANAASTYLTQSTAASTYLTQSSASATYLTQSSASSTYATNANLGNYMPKSGGTFTGGVTVQAGFTILGSSTDFGAQVNLAAAASGGLNTPTLLQYQGKFLFYEAAGGGRGAYLDWSNLSGWSNNKILTSGDLSGYATQSFVTGQGYITSSALSPYMPRSGGTFTGQVSTNGSGTGNSVIGNGTGGLGDLVVTGNGTGAAFMSFLRPGVFAAYLGIDTDNVWKVGGWSMGSASYNLWHSGNFNPGSYQPAGNYQAALGYTPVRQGGGANQGANTVYLGWDGGGLRAQVDSSDLGQLALRSDLGSYATTAQLGNYVTTAQYNEQVANANIDSRGILVSNGTFATVPLPGTYKSSLVLIRSVEQPSWYWYGIISNRNGYGGFIVQFATLGFNTSTTLVLTGSAGVSGKMTISTANGVDGFYIENRAGGDITVCVSMFE